MDQTQLKRKRKPGSEGKNSDSHIIFREQGRIQEGGGAKGLLSPSGFSGIIRNLKKAEKQGKDKILAKKNLKT